MRIKITHNPIKSDESFRLDISYLKAKYQDFINLVDIFSTKPYQNTAEMAANSLAYFGYFTILGVLNSTLGRLALLGFAVYDFYNGNYLSGFWNLYLCVPLVIELITACMALLSVYRLFVFAYEKMNRNDPKISGENTNTISSEDSNKEKKETLLDTYLDVLKKDFMRKKKCVTSLFESACNMISTQSNSANISANR